MPKKRSWGYDDYGYYDSGGPLAVKGGGIKVKSTHGAIGESWWSKRWIGVLESFGMGTRLTKGRSYARKGQVAALDIVSGVVKAKVQGSQPKPYSVTIKLKALTGQEWDQVTTAMADQALFAAKLLAGEMPQNIEEAFGAAHVSLMPTSINDLETDCTCPDWANPCKHIAAVYYLLAEKFDEDPFLIFKLRGRTKEQIIAALREKRAVAEVAEASDISSSAEFQLITPLTSEQEPVVPALEESLETFWQADQDLLDKFMVRITPPEVNNALLKRLGEAPFQVVGNHSVVPILARAYEVASAAALKKAKD